MRVQGLKITALFLIGVLFLGVCFVYAETIVLKSGKTVEGKLIEKADKYIKIDFQGVELTYFFDEIETIDGVKQALSPAKEIKSTQENSLSVQTESVKEYFNRGLDSVKQGNFLQAVSDFTKAIAIDPNNANAYNNRAIARYMMKDCDQAWEDVHKAESLGITINPVFLEALKKASEEGKYIKTDSQSTDMKTTLRIDPEAEKFYLKAADLINAGRFSEAVEEYKKAIQIDPKFPLTYINLGSVYNSLKQYSEAITAYKKAIELAPDAALAYGNLGSSYFYLGRLNEAIITLNKAIEIDPNYVEAYARLGLTYLHLGNFEEAINYSKKSISIKPSAEVYGNLGLAYKGAGKIELAKDSLLKAKEMFIKEGRGQIAQRIEQDLKSL